METIHDEIIEKLRKEMIDAGMKLGLENEITIQLSKKLDKILNDYGKKK